MKDKTVRIDGLILHSKGGSSMIKRIKRVLEHEGSILDVYSDYMELPDGKVEKWDYVEHRNGAAAVVAVQPDGRLLMVRQYRNALEDRKSVV